MTQTPHSDEYESGVTEHQHLAQSSPTETVGTYGASRIATLSEHQPLHHL